MDEMRAGEVSNMDEVKTGVLLYTTHWRILKKLTMEQRDHIFHAIFALVDAEEMPELDYIEDLAFTSIRENVLDNIAKWNRKKEACSKGGKKARENDRKKKEMAEKAISDKHSSTTSSDLTKLNVVEGTSSEDNLVQHNVNVNVNDNVNVNANVNANVNKDNKTLCASSDAPRTGKSPTKKEFDNHFEQLWALYPLKRGKNQVSDTTKKKLFKVDVDAMKQAIERYKNEVAHASFDQSLMNGSTWFNGRYLDYMGSDYTPPTQSQHQKRFDKRSDPYMGGTKADWDRSWREE